MGRRRGGTTLVGIEAAIGPHSPPSRVPASETLPAVEDLQARRDQFHALAGHAVLALLARKACASG
jgi:hypothetical protein